MTREQYLEEKLDIVDKERIQAMKLIWFLIKRSGGSITVDSVKLLKVPEDWEILRRDDEEHPHIMWIEAR